MVAENLNQVCENIEKACKKVGRDPKEVTLIAVSKTKPVSMIQEAYDAGSRDFGENKVQEIMDKHPVLPPDIRWHMIGHLQRNKVKYIIDKTVLIHSVDSLRLAQEISAQAQKKQVTADILVEVNIAQEDISKLPHIYIKGLMTIAPFVTNPEDNRVHFQQIRELSVDIAKKNIDNVTMSVLSMGMTGDYMVAIEEGSTMVRVGTGIFGERNKK